MTAVAHAMPPMQQDAELLNRQPLVGDSRDAADGSGSDALACEPVRRSSRKAKPRRAVWEEETLSVEVKRRRTIESLDEAEGYAKIEEENEEKDETPGSVVCFGCRQVVQARCVACDACPRRFHAACWPDACDGVCADCQRLVAAEAEQMTMEPQLLQRRLRDLAVALERVASGLEASTSTQPAADAVGRVRASAAAGEFASIDAFVSHLRLLLLPLDSEEALRLLRQAERETDNVGACVFCFAEACDAVCPNPHPLVWTTVGEDSPAKAVGDVSGGLVRVREFGTGRWRALPKEALRLLTASQATRLLKSDAPTDGRLRLLAAHLRSLRQAGHQVADRTGNSAYSPAAADHFFCKSTQLHECQREPQQEPPHESQEALQQELGQQEPQQESQNESCTAAKRPKVADSRQAAESWAASVRDAAVRAFSRAVDAHLAGMSRPSPAESDERAAQQQKRRHSVEMAHLQFLHQLQVYEMEHNHRLAMCELRAAFDLERQALLTSAMKTFESDTRRQVEETKKKQWCAFCGKEAFFYCCWNTAYCDTKCQQKHWPTHMATCTQARAANPPANSMVPAFHPLIGARR